jgi:hypothetical protein
MMAEKNKKCSESACKKAQQDKDNVSGQIKPMSCSLMKMVQLLTLSLLLVSPRSLPGISRILPSSMGETIVAGL